MFGTIAKSFFLTCGSGEASNPLNAFDAALLDAGVGNTNLVRMSSILPPGAREIESYDFPKGAMVPLAYGELTSTEPEMLISAAIAVGIPDDETEAGLIMEHAMEGPKEACEEAVESMVMEGMETIRGLSVRRIAGASVSLTVRRVGAVFAAVVLCP
jgi:arginine decarboxylase